jgi:hypothetical protein
MCADIIVIRHPAAGAADLLLARTVNCKVVNDARTERNSNAGSALISQRSVSDPGKSKD